ncbi:hypothetical protein [Rhodopila sp.]|jgi:hypothetical protein|uniref:hypothetical protein n=1 Tax=Rhodopila sp. TaxID=2480087 RepID=UPI002C4FD197|nr:hypothetical protein [Rhodopila sp.]HVZ09654.1 hypothetical protein [Rhodopila sp.]
MSSQSSGDGHHSVDPIADISDALDRLLRQTTISHDRTDKPQLDQSAPEPRPVPPLNWPPNLFAEPVTWSPAAI